MKDNTFIGVYENVLTETQCEEIIDYFEKSSNSFSVEGDEMSHRNDEQLFIYPDSDTKLFNFINESVEKCYNLYMSRYWVIKNNNIHFGQDHLKIQKTSPRGGYHTWHCEINTLEVVDRCLVWILYLNTIPKGEGETEFLWQGVRIQPKAGTMVIWPAFFTHPHRGNPVYSCSKYIATGWGHYQSESEYVEDYFEHDDENHFIRRKN